MSKTATSPTPGPWEADCDLLGEGDITRDWGIYLPLKGKLIACLRPCEQSDFEPGEIQANARLMAAAPEMLAALEEFLQVSPKHRHSIDLECMIEAAIAKAKGA